MRPRSPGLSKPAADDLDRAVQRHGCRLRAAGVRGGAARRRRPPVLAVKRYDRQDAPAGGIPVRVHQEAGCQATATPPGLKYEEQGGPALRDLADVIRNFGDPRDVTSLLRRTTFNMAVGNADAHAKNFSVLHEPGIPAVRLASLYDVLSTIALELTGSAGQPMQADTHLSQRVGGQADIRDGDRGQPDRRGGYLGDPATRGISGGDRDPGPGARRHPGDIRRCPGSRCHPRAGRADQPRLTAPDARYTWPGIPDRASPPKQHCPPRPLSAALPGVAPYRLNAVRSGITLRSLGGTPGCKSGLIPMDGSRRRRQP